MSQDLFATAIRLPLERANVVLQRAFLVEREARDLYALLRDSLLWEQPCITVAGREHKIPRLQAWYGDRKAIYTYSKRTFAPNPWTTELLHLRNKIERACGASFNSVLANYYRSGNDGMGFHADNERELGVAPVIASISLGATRRFVFKPSDAQDKQRYELNLEEGDLLVMSADTQSYWHHGLPKTRLPVAGRINLTFRYVAPVTGLA